MDFRSDAFRIIAIVSLGYVLQGCGGGGGDTAATDPTADADPDIDVQISGSVGDGPVANAQLTVRSNSGQVLQNAVSSQLAGYDVALKVKGKYYALSLEASGGTDLVTNLPPDFKLKSAALDPRTGTIANLNPFTTLAVSTAGQMSGGASSANIKTALNSVVTQFNSGLSTLATSGVMNTKIDASNLGEIVKSSETLAEVFRRVNTIRVASGKTSSVDDVIDVLAADLADGKLDGIGAAKTDAKATAAAVVVGGQVVVEALTNGLQVNGQAVAPALDRVIGQLSSNRATSLSGSQPITAGMIAAARVGTTAANAITPSAALAALGQSLGRLTPGMLPADAAAVLPSGASAAFAPAVTQITAGAANDVATVNAISAGAPPVTPVTNSAPTISGTPATSATVGTQYSFQPTAADANGDPLTFSITNRPAWATFNAQTGLLSGTPPTGSAGTSGNIVISVSDGTATMSLPAFTITVKAANSPPTISGAPATSVMQGTLYTFQPTASDPNGDALTFSIVNRPTWATFSATTGRLEGTPGPGDVGTTSGIVIKVSDGVATASIGPFNIAVQAVATGSATLSWQPPTQNSDGSPLTNLAGYKVYWGTVQGTYPNSVTINNPGIATYVVTNLAPNTYFFAVTAVNTSGVESAQSNSASKTIP